MKCLQEVHKVKTIRDLISIQEEANQACENGRNRKNECKSKAKSYLNESGTTGTQIRNPPRGTTCGTHNKELKETLKLT